MRYAQLVFSLALLVLSACGTKEARLALQPITPLPVATRTGATTGPAVPLARLDVAGGIDCPTSTTCYAAGHNGAVARSSDGGSSWQALPVTIGLQPDQYIALLRCPAVLVCFALARGTNPYMNVYATTIDGGASWSLQGIRTIGSAEDIEGLSCPEEKICYGVTNDGVQVTKDGGSTWINQELSRRQVLDDISCLDANTCFAVGGVWGPEGSTGNILATTDGWKRWADQTAEPALPLRVISCPTTMICMAGGRDGAVRRTTDGGKHWNNVDLGSKQLLYTITAILCPDPHHCLAAARGDLITDPNWIYVTSDGGASWQGHQFDGKTIEGFACPTARNCFAWGTANDLLATDDG